MKKSLFFKLVMLLAVVTLTVNCKDYDNDIDNLNKQLAAQKTELAKDFGTKMDAEIQKLKKQISDLEAAGKGKVDAKDLESKYVSLAMYEAFKNDVEAKIKAAGSSADLTAIETNINSIEGRLKALEILLEIKDGKSPYNFKDLLAKVNANETAIKNLTEKGIDKDAFKKEFDALMEKMGVNISGLSGKITSLVLLPDYVADNGGALPVLNFSPLKTDKCGDIVPAVLVRYVVNPSTATADQIDVENLKFRYNDPIAMRARNTAGVDQKAEFVSLEKGILTVKATLDTEKLWSSKLNTENRIDQLMLEVPMKGSDEVVSSDWAKVVYVADRLAIVKKPKAPHKAVEPWRLFELKDYVHQLPGNHTVSETVTLGVEVGNTTMDYTVVDMEYNKDLNLKDYVQAMYKSNWGVVELEKYGLRFEFDLINHETNKAIVYKLGPNNNTDQQEFIKIKDGHFVTTRVYTLDGNRAAVGRTPIVHVMLVRGEGDNKCIARQGYIKLNIVEKIAPVVKPVKYVKAIEAKCGDHEVYRVGTKEMNENFYHSVNMTKKEFHEKYTFTQTALISTDPTNVGLIQQVVDPNVTESYNLVYTIDEDHVWGNIGRTAWAEGEYVYGNHKIKVRFEAPITKETVKLNIALDNYWDHGYNYIVHNVRVPNVNETTSSTCTWNTNNISSAFKTYNEQENTDITVNTQVPHKDKFNLLNLGYRQDAETMKRYNTYTYEYKFFKSQPTSPVEDIRLSASADGKELRATRGATVETIAKILDQDGAAATGKGDILEYMENSELGKELLNAGPEAMKATVELIVKNDCDRRVNVVVKNLPMKDKFYVHFLRPVNVAGESEENFIDAVNFGAKGSYLDIKSVVKLSDWRNITKKTDAYDFSKNLNFYDYYGVTDIKVDVANIKVKNLKVSGVDVERLPNTIVVEQTPNGDTFNGIVYKYGRLTYKNNGANLKDPFVMYLPVTVTYKWGEVKSVTVAVTVLPTSKNN